MISFAILEQSRVILSFVFAGQAVQMQCIVICINPPQLFVDNSVKSPKLQIMCNVPFAVKWAAATFSSDCSKFLYCWLWFWANPDSHKIV